MYAQNIPDSLLHSLVSDLYKPQEWMTSKIARFNPPIYMWDDYDYTFDNSLYVQVDTILYIDSNNAIIILGIYNHFEKEFAYATPSISCRGMGDINTGYEKKGILSLTRVSVTHAWYIDTYNIFLRNIGASYQDIFLLKEEKQGTLLGIKEYTHTSWRNNEILHLFEIPSLREVFKIIIKQEEGENQLNRSLYWVYPNPQKYGKYRLSPNAFPFIYVETKVFTKSFYRKYKDWYYYDSGYFYNRNEKALVSYKRYAKGNLTDYFPISFRPKINKSRVVPFFRTSCLWRRACA